MNCFFFLEFGEDKATCDQFAVHFTNIVNCLVTGSMSAKVGSNIYDW